MIVRNDLCLTTALSSDIPIVVCFKFSNQVSEEVLRSTLIG